MCHVQENCRIGGHGMSCTYSVDRKCHFWPSEYVQKKFGRFSFLHNQERRNGGGGGGGGGRGGFDPHPPPPPPGGRLSPLPLKVEVATNIGNSMTFYILCTYVATNIKLAGVYLT